MTPIVVEVFDPPLCCSTGVCGPRVDPALVRFASLLERLRRCGVEVRRRDLAHEPGAFAGNSVVREALDEGGPEVLPIVLVDGVVVSRGAYPEGEALAAAAGVKGGCG